MLTSARAMADKSAPTLARVRSAPHDVRVQTQRTAAEHERIAAWYAEHADEAAAWMQRRANWGAVLARRRAAWPAWAPLTVTARLPALAGHPAHGSIVAAAGSVPRG